MSGYGSGGEESFSLWFRFPFRFCTQGTQVTHSSESPPPAEACFGSFRLEQAERLWCGTQLVEVRPRPLAVLHDEHGPSGSTARTHGGLRGGERIRQAELPSAAEPELRVYGDARSAV